MKVEESLEQWWLCSLDNWESHPKQQEWQFFTRKSSLLFFYMFLMLISHLECFSRVGLQTCEISWVGTMYMRKSGATFATNNKVLCVWQNFDYQRHNQNIKLKFEDEKHRSVMLLHKHTSHIKTFYFLRFPAHYFFLDSVGDCVKKILEGSLSMWWRPKTHNSEIH